MIKVARKIPLRDEGKDDAAYWGTRSPRERLKALAFLRQMYIDAYVPPSQQRFSRVYRIVKLKSSPAAVKHKNAASEKIRAGIGQSARTPGRLCHD